MQVVLTIALTTLGSILLDWRLPRWWKARVVQRADAPAA